MRSPRALVTVAAAAVLAAGMGSAHAAAPAEWTPTRPPTNLALVQYQVARSMVTITCGSTIGTGFSAYVDWTEEEVAEGWKSLIVTMDTTVAACAGGDVTIQSNGVTGVATTRTRGNSSGLASLYSKTPIPHLEIGDTPVPVPGQWIGAMGADAGAPTSLVQGTVASVSTNSLTSTLPASLSGGPVVESRGRLIGIMTPSGVVTGTPLFCGSIYACAYPDRMWWAGLRVPGPPTDVKAKPGDRQATVTWKAPADDGGDEVYAYDVYDNTGRRVCVALESRLSCTATGLTNGTAYTFTVIPFNRAGDGVRSAPSASVTPRKAPGAVTKLRALGVAGGVRVTWAAASAKGSARVTGYEYRVGSGSWMRTKDTSVTIRAKAGERVSVAIRAVSAVGPGPESTVSARAR